jgi:ribonuclease HI
MLHKVSIYTDGACLGNPGPGGYAAVLVHPAKQREVVGGFRLTTNNRMEITAAIEGLRALKTDCRPTVYSDSEYLVNAMANGWADKWKANDWVNRRKPVPNADLWGPLLELRDRYQAEFEWIRGHIGHEENELCDRLAVNAAKQANLPPDEGCERDHPGSAQATPTVSNFVAPQAVPRETDARARKILAILERCSDDSDTKRLEYDDSDGFIVYASTRQAAWRYAFRNLDHAYSIATSKVSIRQYRTDI